MVITSKNRRSYRKGLHSAHLRFALVFVTIAGIALIFLNIYCSTFSRQLFYENKQNILVEKTQFLANEIQELDALTPSGIASCVGILGNVSATEVIITDHTGSIIYSHHNTDELYGQQAGNSKITAALQGLRVFTCRYDDSILYSEVAIPVASYGAISGCVYLLEADAELGRLLQLLQIGIFAATTLLELCLIFIAVVYAKRFSSRMKRIISSISVLQEGNYTHKLELDGNDELTLLGSEFNDLAERLQVSETQRRQFVSDASHELKTPLASIKLLSDSILQYDMDIDTTKEFVADIGNEADRLIRMTGKLLALTKGEATDTVRHTGLISMVPTMERVAKMISGIASEKQITVELNLIQDSYVMIPEDDLYQIAFNLAENGIKYNLPGGRLIISLFREGNNAILQIEDTGVGIPPESIDHIFERFYRVDKARSRQTGGSGLGLSIVHSVIKKNHCRISVKSTVGRGTAFIVELPRFEFNGEKG